MGQEKNSKKTEKRWLTKGTLRDIIIELTAKNALASDKAAKNKFKKLLTKRF